MADLRNSVSEEKSSVMHT